MVLHVATLNLKQALDRVTQESLPDAMLDSLVLPTLAAALLKEQIGGRNTSCFQDLQVMGVGFDKSIKQGG